MEISEKELIRRAKNGDRLAQSEIVKTYEKMVYNLGLKLLGNEDAAEGVLQETFLKVSIHRRERTLRVQAKDAEKKTR